MRLLALLAALALLAPVARAAPEWEDETVTDVNTEPPRATSVPYPSRDAALAGTATDRTLDLNGTWRFHLAKRPEDRPIDFFKPDFNVSAWRDIRVPGNWQTQGFGRTIFTNVTYPFANDPPRVTSEPPKDWVAYENRNEVGSYRREFELPAAWAGQEVFLHFRGVESAMRVWVNGEKIGYSEDSYTPAEFRVTPHVRAGKNTVAVEVYRWSDGSYLEDQDFVRLSGIFRDVFLWAAPATHLRDFKIEATHAGALKVDAKVRNLGGDAQQRTLALELIDADGKTVLTKDAPADVAASGEASITFAEQVDAPKTWTAETPHLYTLLLTLKDGDHTLGVDRAKVGFRTVELRDQQLWVNGVSVKLRGVNRHEVDPDHGRTVSEELMRRDLLILKQHNVDTVRTSHYPNHPRWYELCDELGMYVIDEANVESHGTGYGRDSLSHKPSWEKAHVERVAAMVARDKNHACVIFWSLGNEAGPGENHAASRRAALALDATRPVHYEGNRQHSDVVSEMYTSQDGVRRHAKSDDPKPFFLCEYAHAMGNSGGGLADYWAIVESSRRTIGGCVWDYVDQGLRQKSPTRSPDGKDYHFAYGGDFGGDLPNDQNGNCDGLVTSDRQLGAEIAELRRVYQRVAFEMADGQVKLWNKHAFTTTAGMSVQWSMTCDGTALARGERPAPVVAPGDWREVTPPVLHKRLVGLKPGTRLVLNVALVRDDATPWCAAGHVVAQASFDVSSMPAETAKLADMKPPVNEGFAANVGVDLPIIGEQAGDVVEIQTIRGAGYVARIDEQRGALASLVVNGRELIKDAPTPQVFRAPTDNDVWIDDKWDHFGLADLKLLRVAPSETFIGGPADPYTRYRVARTWGGRNGFELTEDATYTFFADGTIDVAVQFDSTEPDLVVARQGVRLMLPRELDRLTWFGRGPLASYPDRQATADLGRWQSTVAEQFEPHARPQSMGSHEGTEWLALTDAGGRGVLVSSPDAFAFSALRFTEQDLIGKRHPTAVVERDATVLSLDAAVLGLGSASCGPRPEDKYVIRAGPRVLRYRLRAIDASSDLSALARLDYPLVAPVSVARDRKGTVTLACATPGAQVSYAVDGGAPQPYAGPFALPAGGQLVATATADGRVAAPEARAAFDKLVDRSAWRAAASSEHPGEGNAAHAVDGDPATYWHTQYAPATPQPPHELAVDLGAAKPIKAITYLPRQDMVNGHVRDYELWTSPDGERWTQVAAGRFDNGDALQTVAVAANTTAQHVKLVAKTMTRGQLYASCAELGMVER